ncbi:Mce protein [Nocardia sp. NPDC048505]|uniref:Mce protein n=1 Tax=unclassified Nocardia TaxID=2637762 RepID=UPI0033E0ABC4
MPENPVQERDADADVVTETTETETAAAPRTPLRRRVLAAAVVLAMLGLTMSTGVLGWKYQSSRDVDAAADAALRAATAYAVTLTSVDTAAIDSNFQAVLDGSTGEFREVYTKSSTQLRQLLIDHKATGHGVVLQAAVRSASEDEVVVLLFVDQTVSNTEMPDPRIDRSRIVMTMQNVGGQWKAAQVDIP